MENFSLFPQDILLTCHEIGTYLREKNLGLATAESCTGGLLGGALTSVPGSSNWFPGGVVAYADRIKQRVLSVPKDVLDMHGAVSRECVRAMCRGLERLFETDCSMAVSGIAGPGGGTQQKPVGTVWIAWRMNGQGFERRFDFSGERQAVRMAATRSALQHLAQRLKTLECSPRD